ncbi:hypothetical protein GOC91_03350 [Sinorhizobium medicae]|nr:hypothetical protein [Sinorhizobium medicae]MDX0625268.1 hypothetical protein [Sinorhizobium medicae]MDX0877937.1 hypothetical protein [Sinorhizobium medicae]MDX1224639.1 hypothetical protein [Sinorhizobium medicae]
MTRDAPTSEQIMEDLANKVALQIERLASVAFDRALDELIRYHRFLLSLNASTLPDGTPFSYAEIASGFLPRFPYHTWVSQYRRLYERAVNRIGDDPSFIERLASVPIQLLPRPGDPQQPPAIIASILNLGPMLTHRLEAWVTKRTVADNAEGDSAGPRALLAGSDSTAYAQVLRTFIGQWETLLQITPTVYGSKKQKASIAERWSSYARTWPLLSQHLQNTAYMLAVAVWNEDETGAAVYSDALIRWLERSSYRWTNGAELLNRRLLFPDISHMHWSDAVIHIRPILPGYLGEPAPDRIFSSILQGVHDDCVLITAAVLLSWHVNNKLRSDIGARTAVTLLRRNVVDTDVSLGRELRADLSFRSAFLNIMRIELAGERFREEGYGKELDRLASSLDSMSERPVVPGRVYTPSTMDDREGLQPSMLAILLAAVPLEGDGGLGHHLGELLQNEAALPDGDRSLRNLLRLLGTFGSMLDTPANLLSGASGMSANVDFDAAIPALRTIIEASIAAIQSHRRERLEERPVDPAKIERIRAAMDDALLTPPAKIPFFRGFTLQGGPESVGGDVAKFEITWVSKGELVEPPMETEPANFIEAMNDTACFHASHRIWRQFILRPRQGLDVSASVDDEAFWRVMTTAASRIGPEPVLLVSQRDEGRIIRRFIYAKRGETLPVRIERKPRDEYGGHGGSYIATIEDIDVYGTDLGAGTALLFSARILRSVIYDSIDGANRHIQVSFENGGEGKGVLAVHYKQSVEWGDGPILEITFPAVEAQDGAEL